MLHLRKYSVPMIPALPTALPERQCCPEAARRLLPEMFFLPSAPSFRHERSGESPAATGTIAVNGGFGENAGDWKWDSTSDRQIRIVGSLRAGALPHECAAEATDGYFWLLSGHHHSLAVCVSAPLVCRESFSCRCNVADLYRDFSGDQSHDVTGRKTWQSGRTAFRHAAAGRQLCIRVGRYNL